MDAATAELQCNERKPADTLVWLPKDDILVVKRASKQSLKSMGIGGNMNAAIEYT